MQAMLARTGKPCPTRLADGTEMCDHEDWDCVEDMVSAGLVEWRGTGVNPVLILTDAGWARAHALRRALARKRIGGAS